MNATRDCPSPGDSTTDLSGIEDAGLGLGNVDDSDDSGEAWSPPDWKGIVVPEISGSVPDRSSRKRPSRAEDPVVRQRLLLIVLASYASAVTIALLYLLATDMSGRAHDLESLPDVAPLDVAEFQYAPQQASLPPGHELNIGESRQYGYIRVEPLRVTKGMVEFVHFSGHALPSAPESVPAFKLWVRFTNVSKDQRIAPLDRLLLFKRDYLDESDQVLSNNFIKGRADRAETQPLLFVLDHPLTSEWNLKQQSLGVRLNPGESVVAFLPSQSEGMADVHGDLLWRMHIRKGYHAATGHGVTTLVEVAFNEDEIETETGENSASG